MGPITLRAFGRPEDLDVEFTAADRPALVTALLARCSNATDPTPLWQLPVAVRIGALAHVVALTEGADTLTLPVRCTHPECGELAELPLSYEALRGLAAEAEARPTMTMVISASGATVTLRRPTGDDQRTWRARRFTSTAEIRATMLASLLAESDGTSRPAATDGATLDEASDALADFDPLVAFRIDYVCPACGTTRETPVDLQALLLDRLAACQDALVRQVHVLASHYAWTEAEVLAIPAARRARYLALLDDVMETRR